MRIRKVSNTRPLSATVVSEYNNNQINAYSCDYLNGKTGVVLYNAGTVGNVTLSDSSANYSAIEVYAQKSGCWGSTKIYSPNGKQFGLSIHNAYDTTAIQQLFGNYTISGNTIVKNRELYMNDNGTPMSSNDIAIQFVIGYK